MWLVQMPRKARVEYEGTLYHVMDRGNRLERFFVMIETAKFS